MNKELMEALSIMEKDKEISKEALFDAICNSLVAEYKKVYKENEDVRAEIDTENFEFHVYIQKEVVETEDDVSYAPNVFISLEDARKINPDAQLEDLVYVEIKVDPKDFGRIQAQNVKNVITQKIREEERNMVYNQYRDREHDIITGIVHRKSGKNWIINLGKTDAVLTESEQIPSEKYEVGARMKFYVLEVKSVNKGSRITVSRTHPDLVKRLFEEEVIEIKNGTVEIMSIAREAGSRSKMAVYSTNPQVDPVGACVGEMGNRVNTIVKELRGEKIDIICYDENPSGMIRNALSPAEIIQVFSDPEEKTAKVVVPDDQLSLAIGKAGQNARLAAKLTGFKIDIKSESQAVDAVGFREEDYMYDEYEMDGADYEEDYAEESSAEYYAEDEMLVLDEEGSFAEEDSLVTEETISDTEE